MLERYVIHTTKLCNMSCSYCYEKDKTSTYTWEEIEALLKNIAEQNKEKECSIEFLGGEPLIAFDHIKKSVEYLENIEGFYVDHYIITTNGTLINDKIIDWLKANPKVMVGVSLDGGKVANQLRVYKAKGRATYEDVARNTKWLLEEIGSDRVSCHLVTHPWNVYLLSKSVKHIYNLGVRHFSIGIIESTGPITREYADRFIQEMHKISNYVKRGELPGAVIDLFDYLKPISDVRKYIRDPETGKVLGESYGRSESDITHTDIYDTVNTTSPVAETIAQMREQVYTNHQVNMREV